jgi:hypothetical protein
MKHVFAVICMSVALTAPACFAQSSAPAPSSPAPASSSRPGLFDPAVQGYGDHDKTCLAWTDRCTACTREADDKIACSNTGIACQPAEITCTTRKTEPKPEPKSEPKSEPKQEPKPSEPAK